MSLLSRSIGCLRSHRPQYLTHLSVILVWHQGTALSWFRSYLSSRCFHVNCNDLSFLSKHLSLWCTVSTNAQFLTLYSLSCIQPHSILLSHLCPQINTCMQTIHNSSFLSIHQNSTLISLTCKMFYNRSLPGWLQTFLLSTLLKLSFFLSDLNNNFLKLVPRGTDGRLL